MPKTRKTTPKEFYVNKSEMLEEIISYKKTGIISEKLGEMFLKIAQRFTSKGNFCGYSYREDMISEAVYRMVTQVDKFDVNHPSANPFAYFTQVAYHQILGVLNREKKQRIIKDSVREKIWDELCEEEGLAQMFDSRKEEEENNFTDE